MCLPWEAAARLAAACAPAAENPVAAMPEAETLDDASVRPPVENRPVAWIG